MDFIVDFMSKRFDKKKSIRIVIASFAIVFLMVLGSSGSYVAGNSPANSPATPASKVAVVDTNGTFIFGSVQGPLTDLNPLTATSTAGDISALLYSSLLYPGSSGGVVPWLAKSYNISDQGKLFTFNMVTNATWSNGNPVTSKDVNFTFQSILNHPSVDFNQLNKYIASIDATSTYTVVFHMKQYYNPLLYEIGTEPIIPAAWGNSPYTANISSFTNYATNITSGSYNASKLITDGPVMLTSMTTVSGADFKTNKNFFNGAPDYARMIWEFFKTTSDATAALESKSIDAFWGPYTDASLFAKLNYLKSVSAPSTYTFYAWLNNKVAPFNNTDLRKAVAFAINKHYINKVALAGAGLNGSNGGLPYTFRNQVPTGLPFYHYNLTAAANMMTKGGFTKTNGEWYYPNGTQVQITIIEPPLADWVTAGQIISQNLTAFGIKTTYAPETFANWANYVGNGNFQMTYFGFTGASPTAWSVLNTLFTASSSAPIGQTSWTHGWNVERYNNTTVNNLLSEAASTPNLTLEQSYLNQVQQAIANQLPLIMIDDPPTFFTYNNHTVIDNTPNYNIAWMISIEHMQIVKYQNQSVGPSLMVKIIIVGAVVGILAVVAAAVVLRTRKKKESEKEED